MRGSPAESLLGLGQVPMAGLLDRDESTCLITVALETYTSERTIHGIRAGTVVAAADRTSVKLRGRNGAPHYPKS